MKKIFNKIKTDRALHKTISYRILVFVGGALIFAGSWMISKNPAGTIAGGLVAGEAYRSAVYYLHEKWWANQKVN